MRLSSSVLPGANVTLMDCFGFSPMTSTLLMNPSRCSNSQSSCFMRECGAVVDLPRAACALRMRVRRSPMGSVTNVMGWAERPFLAADNKESPGRFRNTRDLAIAGELTEANAADSEETDEPV